MTIRFIGKNHMDKSRKIGTDLFLELENLTQEPLESILTVMEARPGRHILPKLRIRPKSCQKP